ncbi:MAG: VCBS repeat-containing protein, partial [Flavobacteriales bacterium]|nr:VCBS repeat-containing protein [Flavobacteriales bacterium]
MKLTLSICIWACCAQPLLSQTFLNAATAVGIDVHVYDNLHGAGVSFVDFDQDGLDDLTFCEDSQIKFYRNNQGDVEELVLSIEVSNNANHPIWVDYDNDGDLDFFISQMQGPNLLFEQTSAMVFENVTSDVGLPLLMDPSFGCSWGDYDRDGDL